MRAAQKLQEDHAAVDSPGFRGFRGLCKLSDDGLGFGGFRV